MGFNSGKIKVQSTAKKKTKNSAWKDDMPWSLAGQWEYPGQVTKVPSGDITMQGVPYPVLGVDEYGNQQMMTPGGEYQFPGNTVTEYPMMQAGGSKEVIKTDTGKHTELWRYNPITRRLITKEKDIAYATGDEPREKYKRKIRQTPATGFQELGKRKFKAGDRKELIRWDEEAGDIVYQEGGALALGAGPLREQNPYLVPEYTQPMAGGYILPDVNRPILPGTSATEYKMSYDTGTPDEIQIPSVVSGQYLGDRALERFGATGEQFKPMADPSSYSQYYDMVNRLGLMKQQYGGQNLKQNTMNYYGKGGTPCYECGGGIHFQEGGEADFSPHMMYDPITGEGYDAATYADHIRMEDMGYGHEPIMQTGGQPHDPKGMTHIYKMMEQQYGKQSLPAFGTALGSTAQNFAPWFLRHMYTGARDIVNPYEPMPGSMGMNDGAALRQYLINRRHAGIDANPMYEEQLNALPDKWKQDNLPFYAEGGNWMQDIKSTGQCTGKNFGGPRCRPGTREYAFAKRARSGEFNKKYGGGIDGGKMKPAAPSSTAPQNADIDSIGKTRIDLMKNYLAENTMKSMLKQKEQELKESQMNYFKNGGSKFNPNMSYADMYEDAQAQAAGNFNRDFGAFSQALGTAADQRAGLNAREAKAQEAQAAQQRWAQDMQAADSSMYSFANDPAGVPSYGMEGAQSPAWQQYMTPMSSGQTAQFRRGGMPKYQDAGPVAFATTVDGLSPYDAAVQDRIRQAEIARRNAAYRPTPVTPSYGQQLVQQVGRPNPIMTDMYPDASSAEGLTPGVDWNAYAAEQQRLANLINPAINPLSTDRLGATAPGLPPYMTTPSDVQGAQSGAFGYDPATMDAIDRANWAAAAGHSADPTVSGGLPTITLEELEALEAEQEKIKQKANTPKKGKSAAEKAEIDQAKATVEADKAADKAAKEVDPNYKETAEDKVTTTTGTAGQYPYGPYGGLRKRKTKVSYVDPATGKRVRLKDKQLYDAYGQPTGSGMRPWSPRVVRTKFKDIDIYPGGQQTPYNPGEGVRAPGEDIAPVTPLGIRGTQDPQLAVPPGGFQGVQPSPSQMTNALMAQGYTREQAESLQNTDSPGQPGYFRNLTDAVNAPMEVAARLYGRGQAAPAEQDPYFNVEGFREGGSYFPQPYPGGMEPNGEGAYFFARGGDMPKYQMAGQTAVAGDDPYANTTPRWINDPIGSTIAGDDQQGEPFHIDKAKQVDRAVGNGFLGSPEAQLIAPGLDMISSALEKKRIDEQRVPNTAGDVFTPVTQGDRGKHTVNQGYFDPYNMVPVQFAGNPVDRYAKYGGPMKKYQDAGTVADETTPFQVYLQNWPRATPADTTGGRMDPRPRANSFTGFTPQEEALKLAYQLTYGDTYVPSTNPATVPAHRLQENIWDEQDARIPYKQAGGMALGDSGAYDAYLDENEIAQILAQGGTIEYY